MRPVRRGKCPISRVYNDYKDAKPMLVSRIGSGWVKQIHIACYCSYCERPIPTNLAVEHIQPKGLTVGLIQPYAHLEGRWENFLLACVNCNSTKLDKDVVLSEVLLPDRDNTFIAYEYLQDGTMRVAVSDDKTAKAAANTLSLTGLDKPTSTILDDKKRTIALDRNSQRKQTWLLAQTAKEDVDEEPNNQIVRRQIIKLAVSHGYFSIWMSVFNNDPDIRNHLIDAFSGTRESGCFDPITTQPISPAPNPDGLLNGGKL